MSRRLIRAAVVLGVSAIMTINTFAMTFKDVANTHWAYTSIQYMQEKGYMVASSTGEFRPNEQMDYFDLVEILAKATGYQDELIVKDMDEVLKEQIRKNYEVQKPILQKYNSQYSGWRNSANEEIAYLLGRGYLTEAELGTFMSVDSAGKQVKNIVTKEDLAVFLVRILHKEETAKKEYKAGAFTDESKIAESKRPHVAYLKTLGLINGDANGAFGAGTKITRALCAKMTTDVLKYQASSAGGGTTTEDANMKAATIKNIVPKNDTESYVLLEYEGGSTSFSTIQSTTSITSVTGTPITIDMVAIGSSAKVVVEKVNGSDVITKMQITAGGTTTTPDTGSGSDTTTPSTTTTHTGTVVTVGSSSLTVSTSKGTVSYPMSSAATVIINNQVSKLTDIEKGDTITMDVKDGEILKVNITRTSNESTVSGKELKSKVEKKDSYVITLTDNKVVTAMKNNVDIIRNGEEADFLDLKLGDEMNFVIEGGYATKIEAKSEVKTLTGTIQSITIATQPEVTIQTEDGTVTLAITTSSELYDKKAREDIQAKDLLLNSQVQVQAESKEVLSLNVTAYPKSVSYKGTIVSIAKNGQYIDVLVDYDEMLQESKIVKRINVPSTVSIQINGKEQYRNLLKEGMDILVTYQYAHDSAPQTIRVID